MMSDPDSLRFASWRKTRLSVKRRQKPTATSSILMLGAMRDRAGWWRAPRKSRSRADDFGIDVMTGFDKGASFGPQCFREVDSLGTGDRG